MLFPEDSEVSDSHSFYQWFYPAAVQWLYISSYKAHHDIKKAIHLDQFTLVDSTEEYSSSAVDTLHVFEQVRPAYFYFFNYMKTISLLMSPLHEVCWLIK